MGFDYLSSTMKHTYSYLPDGFESVGEMKSNAP